MIIIKAEYARLIQAFQSSEETRYYLNGFLVEPSRNGGVDIVATDGHVLAVFHDETGSCDKAAIVQLDKTAVAMCKAVKVSRHFTIERYLAVDTETQTATIYHGHPSEGGEAQGSFNRVIVDGTFPDWRRVVPAMPDKPSKMIAREEAWNAGYLAKFGKVTEKGCITIAQEDIGCPALVFTPRTDFFGVVMPMPMRGAAAALPSWHTEDLWSQLSAWFNEPLPEAAIEEPVAIAA